MAVMMPTLAASGTTFAQMKAGNLSWMVEALISAQSPLANPTAPATVSASGSTTSGGLLAPGVYYGIATGSNGLGETTGGSQEFGPFTVAALAAPITAPTIVVGTGSTGALATGGYLAGYTLVDSVTGGESTMSLQSAAFTVTLGNTPTATFPALPATAKAMNVYLSPTNGTSGTEVLYASGVTTGTYVFTSALYTNGTTNAASSKAPPATNNLSSNIPLVTFATITGAGSQNLYLTTANGATGTEVLYADGITTTTFAVITAVDTSLYQNPGGSFAVKPPSVNTTGLTFTDANGVVHDRILTFLRAAKTGNLQDVYRHMHATIAAYSRGEPTAFSSSIQQFRDGLTAIAGLLQVGQEALRLMDANPGHFALVTTGIGQYTTRRQFP